MTRPVQPRSLVHVPLVLIFLVSCWTTAPQAYGQAPTPPPAQSNDPDLDAYAALPALTDVQISPDGLRIAALRPVGQLNGLTILDLETRRSNIALAADPARYQINFCQWANEVRLVCQVRTMAKLALGGRNEARFQTSGLFAVNHDGSNVQQLSENGSLLFGEFNRGAFVSLLPHDRDHILIPQIDPKAVRTLQESLITSNITLWPDVWKVDINDGSRSRFIKAREGIAVWIADDDGVVRGGIGRRAIIRDDKRWRSVDISGLKEQPNPQPLSLSGNATTGDSIYLAANLDSDRRGVVEFNTVTGTITRTMYRDDRFDFDGDSISRAGVLQALFTVDDRLRYIPISDDAKALDAELRGALGGQSALPISHDVAWQRFTVLVAPPDQPATWYLYDRPARKLMRLGSEFPALKPENLPVTTWTQYQARDGMQIPARLTLPVAGAKNLPAILLPHGGPIARDSGFDVIAAFLAHRGYAVLQPQFRGSYGFGKKYMQAGRGQWGLQMQDDLLDGLQWMRSEGIAHATRACTVGLSYGGYAALVAAYKTPEQIQCAVSYAPVTDLEGLVRNYRLYRLDSRGLGYAHLPSDPEVLAANSPAAHAAQIKVPVLLMHADRDTNVLVEQSRTLAAALQAAGKPHRYIEQPDGDHFLGIQSHRREFFGELDRFLRAHLDTQTAQ